MSKQPWQNTSFCEREYNVRAALPDHAEYFKRWQDSSAAARQAGHCNLDVPYGRSALETLDVFPAQGTPRALLMFIHGGYWQARDKSEFSFVAPALNRAGVTVALINYALAPAVRMAEIVRQCRAAAAWLWEHASEFGVDGKGVYVAGHSAGGHLTAMLMETDWSWFRYGLPPDLIKGGLAISGVFDLDPITRTSINDSVSLTAEDVERYSPVKLTPTSKGPLYLCVGGDESSEFHRQSTLIAQAWNALRVEHIAASGCNHLSVVERLGQADTPLFRGALRLMNLA